MGAFKKNILPKKFYQQSTIEIAKNLLGAFLFHENADGITMGRIVETEAYLHDDPACHASRGETKRNKPMFGPPGHAYIYFIYGMYHCFNVVTAPQGIGEAVLIRALEPVLGMELMKIRRQKPNAKKSLTTHELCNGPSKLVMALGIHPKLNGAPLFKGPLKILKATDPPHEIFTTTRIGISLAENLPLRFYIKGNRFISNL